MHPDRRNLSIYEPTSLYFFLFQKSVNTHAICTRRCFCTTKNNFWFTDWPLTKAIVVRRELWSCPCSWGRDVFFFRSAPSFTADLKKNFVVETVPKEEQGWKSIRKWANIWRYANSEQQIKKWRVIAILAQPPSSSPMIAIRTSEHHGSNFSYNIQVLRRKHPVLGLKLNPLYLLFQLERYHHNNTDKQL